MATGLRKLVDFAVLTALTVGAAAAAPIFNIESGTLTVSRLFNTATSVEFGTRDVRGLVALGVSDPGALGSVTVADNTGGVDPNFGAIPFGITSLNGANAGFVELIVLAFDLSNATITPTNFVTQAVGSPNTAVSDPALLRMLGTTTWSFNLSALTPIDATTTIAQYTLVDVSSSQVPEPSTAGLVLIGGAAAFAFAKRRKS